MRTYCIAWGTLRVWSRRITQPRAKDKDGQHHSGPGEGRHGLVPPCPPTPSAEPRPQEAYRPCCAGPTHRSLFFQQPPFCSLHPSPTGLHAISQVHHTSPRPFSLASFHLQGFLLRPSVFTACSSDLHAASVQMHLIREALPNYHPRQLLRVTPRPTILPESLQCVTPRHTCLSIAVRNTETHLLIYHLVFQY